MLHTVYSYIGVGTSEVINVIGVIRWLQGTQGGSDRGVWFLISESEALIFNGTQDRESI